MSIGLSIIIVILPEAKISLKYILTKSNVRAYEYVSSYMFGMNIWIHVVRKTQAHSYRVIYIHVSLYVGVDTGRVFMHHNQSLLATPWK